MTTLPLTAQRIIPYVSVRSRAARVEDYFLVLNARGLLTILSLGVIIAGVIGYLSLVGHTFHLGIQLRAAAAEEMGEERSVKNLDVALREREANFTSRYQAALEGMDKVSSLKYLEPGSVAFNTTQ